MLGSPNCQRKARARPRTQKRTASAKQFSRIHEHESSTHWRPNRNFPDEPHFLDRLEEWKQPEAKVVVSTVPPANDEKDPGNPHRNERHRLYGEQVVKPVVERHIAAGKPYTLADAYPALTTEDLSDSVHPRRAGKAKHNTVWAEAILTALGQK